MVKVGLVDTALETVKKAVTQHSKSVLLWKQYIQLVIRSTSDEKEAIRIFKESQKNVPAKVGLYCVKILQNLKEYIQTCFRGHLGMKENWPYKTGGC